MSETAADLFPASGAHDPGGRVRIPLPAGVVGHAVFGGPLNCYRYQAEYTADLALPTVLFVMMNPSTADARLFDPTLAKCWRYACRWGFGRMLIGNVFAYRTTDQARLVDGGDPVGPHNDAHILEMAAEAMIIVMAYGTPKIVGLRYRGPAVARMLIDRCFPVHALKLSNDGIPCHPLYLPADLEPRLWDGPA